MRIIIVEDKEENIESAVKTVTGLYGDLPVFRITNWELPEGCKTDRGLAENFILEARDYRTTRDLGEMLREKGGQVDLVLLDLYLPINNNEQELTNPRPFGMTLAFEFSDLVKEGGKMLVLSQGSEKDTPHHCASILPNGGGYGQKNVYSINGVRCLFKVDQPFAFEEDRGAKHWGEYLDF